MLLCRNDVAPGRDARYPYHPLSQEALFRTRTGETMRQLRRGMDVIVTVCVCLPHAIPPTCGWAVPMYPVCPFRPRASTPFPSLLSPAAPSSPFPAPVSPPTCFS